jgi:proteasome lid subunit RPN8/RPN11
MLRFSPTAWSKLVFCRDMTDNEVGGFGVTQDDDLLFVTDFVLVKQKVSSVSVAFEDESVADFFEDQVEKGRRPEQFGRVWLHTHPGSSPEPSMTDEETFARVFGRCDWSVMCIVAQDGNTFARLRFSAGPGGELKIPVCIDYSCQFDAADFELWAQQYKANVAELQIFKEQDKSKQPAGDQKPEVEQFGSASFSRFPLLSAEDVLCEIEQMHPLERDAFLDELAVRSNFWDEEMGVLYDG